LDDRLQQGAILRTLGAKRRQLQLMQWIEFVILGALAGFIAVSGAEIIGWFLYQKLFQLQYSWHPDYWLWFPLLSGIIIALLANRSLNAVINQPPLVILRKL
jgi:putative ABC transport system permease protein